MSRKCELTGVTVQYGNNVSHSQRKTRRSFAPNMRNVIFSSELTKIKYKLRIAAKTIRTIEKNDGFDSFVLKADSSFMSDKEKKIQRKIAKQKKEMAQ